MNSTPTLPKNYRLDAEVSMKNNRLLVKLNIAGLLLVVLFGWLFSAAAFWLRPNDAAAALVFNWSGTDGLSTLLFVLLITFATIGLHEAVHSLGFIYFAKARPTFGFRWAYAFAAAPNVYIHRDRYLPIALAPLVVISGLGVALMAVVPPQALMALVLACVVNAAGSVGDLWVVWLLLRLPKKALARDQGEKIELYVPEGQVE